MNKKLSEDFQKYCSHNNISLKENINLSKHTSFRIGGTAFLFLDVPNKQALQKLFHFPNIDELNLKLLGGGTNLLISSNGYSGVIVKLGSSFSTIEEVAPNSFRIGAAVKTSSFARKLSKSAYANLEFLVSIPGCLGGAIIQNAGCYDSELMDFVSQVEYFENGIFKRKSIKQIKYSYRWTEFKKSSVIIVSVLLKKFPSEMPYAKDSLEFENIQNKIESNRQKRILTQPSNRKSAGSVFKNPKNQVAWKLISECGLQGTSKGDAIISNKHANFIVNKGHASSQDVYYLIRLMEEKVFSRFGIKLEREIELLGDF